MKHRKLIALLGCMALAPLAGLAGEAPDGHARGEHWAALDTDGNGTVSLAEAQAGAPRLAEHFAGLDANGDGQLTREEMQAGRGKAHEGMHPRGEHWEALDTDGNGTVSLAEAQAGAPRLAEHFAGLDANGDGQLTREEMQAGRGKAHHDMRARGEERFRSADTNGDGSIDLAEAQSGMPRAAGNFAEIDADGNGLLTHEELRSAMQARRDEHRDRNGPRPEQPTAK